MNFKTYQTSCLVIGSGCAGFNAADTLFDCGMTDVILATEGIKMGTSRNTGSDKQTYYKIVTSDGKEVDYEDGKQEDLTPEEKERAEEYDSSNSNEQTVKPQAFSRRRIRNNVKRA